MCFPYNVPSMQTNNIKNDQSQKQELTSVRNLVWLDLFCSSIMVFNAVLYKGVCGHSTICTYVVLPFTKIMSKMDCVCEDWVE